MTTLDLCARTAGWGEVYSRNLAIVVTLSFLLSTSQAHIVAPEFFFLLKIPSSQICLLYDTVWRAQLATGNQERSVPSDSLL